MPSAIGHNGLQTVRNMTRSIGISNTLIKDQMLYVQAAAGRKNSRVTAHFSAWTSCRLRQARPVQRIIYLEPHAPSKPAPAQPCNGCGVCCAVNPCPLGMIMNRGSYGACGALTWARAESRYRCGLIVSPERHLPALLSSLAPLLSKLARRFISAGSGCDCDWEVTDK